MLSKFDEWHMIAVAFVEKIKDVHRNIGTYRGNYTVTNYNFRGWHEDLSGNYVQRIRKAIEALEVSLALLEKAESVKQQSK